MSKIAISIIVPVYRLRKYLPACLDSLLKQDFTLPYNIMLVETGSDDGSDIICKEYQKNHFRKIFHYHYDKNVSISMARNLGLAHANGEYVCFMDGDDFIKEDFLSCLYKEAKEDEEIDVVSSSYMFLNEDKTMTEIKNPPCLQKEGSKAMFSLFQKAEYNYYCWARLYKRRFLLENKLYFDSSLNMYEDLHFMTMVFAMAKKVAFINKPLYIYRQHDESIVHTCKDFLSLHLRSLSYIKRDLIKRDKKLALKLFRKPSRWILKQIKQDCVKSSPYFGKKKGKLYKEARLQLKEIYKHELQR